MARDRSRSTVQSIASEVVSHASDKWKPESESNEAQQIQNPLVSKKLAAPGILGHFNRERSKSQPIKCSLPRNVLSEIVPLHPFTPAEENNLTQEFLRSLNYNSVLDYKYISDINDCYDDPFLSFQSDCDHNIEYFQTLLADTANITDELNSLRSHYDQVMKDTEEFSVHSRELLRKQEELGTRAEEMDHVMSMFEPLESISKALSTSGTNLIKSGRWRTILSQLEEKLEFFEAHKFYKDAEVYTMRYRQCVTRALTLLRNYNIDFLKEKTEEVVLRLNKGNIDALSLDIMLYSEFTNELEKQTDNSKFSTLIQAMADQCVDHEEYKGLVSDVLNQYFKLRRILVLAFLEKHPLLTAELHANAGATAQPVHQDTVDIVQYCQKAISQYKRILEKEYSVFLKYFPLGSETSPIKQFVDDEFYTFLKQVLEPFYDDMRNKILKETNITELSQLTNLLASYYEVDDDTASSASATENKLEYGELLEPTLNDSQGRLIFRIQNYIDNKLLKYKPKPEDLQLGNRRDSGRRDSILEDFEGNLFPNLYVPVGKALTILSNLYELVNSMVFDDIAHYIVHSCIYMLKHGAMGLANAHLGPSDAKLFYLKNLIMLKNHLSSFDIQFVRTETSLDLTGGIQELIRIFRSGSLSVSLNSQGGFLELVRKSVPKVINDMMDAQKEIELELSNTFNDYITGCTNAICEPILQTGDTNLKEKAATLNDNILMKIPQIHKQIRSYIEEEEFVIYLLNVLSRLILSTYEKYHQTMKEAMMTSNQADELNEIMEPDTFFNFVAETISDLHYKEETIQDKVEFAEDILNVPEAIFQNGSVNDTKSDEKSSNEASQTSVVDKDADKSS